MRWVLASVGIAACLGGCQNPTEIIVAVGTDLHVAHELDGFTITVDQHHGQLRQFEHTWALHDQRDLPRTLALQAGRSPHEPILVMVSGQKSDATLVHRRARLPFVKGQSLLLQMDLLRSCVFRAVPCPDNETCTENGCVPVDVDPATLPIYAGETLIPSPFADGDVPVLGDNDNEFGTEFQSNVVALTSAFGVGNHHACVITAFSFPPPPLPLARCWGLYGLHLGADPDAPTTDWLTPGSVCIDSQYPEDCTELDKVTSKVAGTGFSCALLADGADRTVKCWGTSANGVLGSGADPSQRSDFPVVVCTNSASRPGACTQDQQLTAVASLAASNATACAVKEDGSLHCWGLDVDGITHLWATPVVFSDRTGASSSLRAVGISESHRCAVTNTNKVICWGANENAQLGTGSVGAGITTAREADYVCGSGSHALGTCRELTHVASVTVGAGFSCTVMLNGTVRCWGRNDQGQLGLGYTPTPIVRPTIVCRSGFGGPASTCLTTLDDVRKVVAGEAHACALTDQGHLFCWGRNAECQLAKHQSIPAATSLEVLPVRVGQPDPTNTERSMLTETWQDVAAGVHQTCGLNDDRLRCWGEWPNATPGNGIPTPPFACLAVSVCSVSKESCPENAPTTQFLTDVPEPAWQEVSNQL